MAKKITINVVYVSGVQDAVKAYNEKNYRDIEKIEDSLEDVFGSDDFGIDDVWVDGVKLDVDWKNLLQYRGRLNVDLVEKIFEEDTDEMLVKMQFLNSQGFDIDEDSLDEVYVYDAKRDDIVEGNYGNKYPEGLIDEWAQDYYSDLYKLLEKYGSESYFDWASLFSDNEVNGEFSGDFIGDYYVFKYR